MKGGVQRGWVGGVVRGLRRWVSGVVGRRRLRVILWLVVRKSAGVWVWVWGCVLGGGVVGDGQGGG